MSSVNARPTAIKWVAMMLDSRIVGRASVFSLAEAFGGYGFSTRFS
jgi:hypothetical protein